MEGLGGGPAAFRQAALTQGRAEVVSGQAAAITLLEQFNGVYIQDSTTFQLPDALAAIWRGCGGRIAGKNESSLKVQLQWDYLSGQIRGLELQHGRQHDQQASFQSDRLPAGSLRLSDLGYFNLSVFEAMGAHCYWITRLKAHVLVFGEDGQALNIEHALAHTPAAQVDMLVEVGAERLSCRLVAQRVSPDIAAERRRKLKETARKKGQTVSQRRLALADWTIFLTNVPWSMLSTEQVFIVAGVRWQVELVFKVWKSEFRMDESRSQNPWRILTELYAKLMGWLIQHWLTFLAKPQPPDRSPTKAVHIGKQYALFFANSLADLDAFAHAIGCFQRSIAAYARINKSQKAPHTFQKLLQSSPRSLT